MHIISLKKLRVFWQIYNKSELPLKNWHTVLEQGSFSSFNEIKSIFPSADYVAPFTIFYICGNDFRLIAVVYYRTGNTNIGRVYVREVLTHSQYDVWCKNYQKGLIK
jgi:mRNA interferase HigB